MNNSHTIQHTTAEEGQPTKHTVETAPAFEAEIHPDTLLEILGKHLDILHNNPSEEDILRIKDELASMEVITMPNEDGWSWILESPKLHKLEMERSLGERIQHLLKTKGEWKNKHIRKSDLVIKPLINLPIALNLQPEAEDRLKNGEQPELFFAIVGLHIIIEEFMKKDGRTAFGVFSKPDGIVQLNRMKLWLENSGQYKRWSAVDDLKTTSLLEIVETSVLVPAQ